MLFKKTIERTQWPVGHGGFHTGRLIGQNKIKFAYFYDCGSQASSKSKAKQLIEGELKTRKCEVGVISHFDRDHVAMVGASAPEVLYLPYMTRTDQLLAVLFEADGNESLMASAARIYENLKEILKTSTIIMVSNGTTASDRDTPDVMAPPTHLDAECAFPVVSHDDLMTHDELRFKFFNFHADELSREFSNILAIMITDFKTLANTPYTDVQALLKDIEDDGPTLVQHNIKALKSAYVALLKTKSVSTRHASNLSSLALFTFCDIHIDDCEVRCVPQRNVRYSKTGWMLTGDLELHDQVWDLFSVHYVSDFAKCAIFNLPHHASTTALNWRAMHFLPKGLIYLANANDGDTKHPSPDLYQNMDEYLMTERHTVNEKPLSTFTYRMHMDRHR